MAIYMKYGDIKGEVTAKGYEGRLSCDTAGFGVSRPSSVESGAGQGKRHTDACTCGDMQISRSFDKASPLLFNEACGGEEAEVWIDFTKTEKTALVTYLQFKMKQVLITSYSVSGGEAGATEALSLNFGQIQVIHTSYDADGKESQTKGKFNVITATVG
jgi:type VI secretion system secreted protein Hcp